MHAYAGRQFVPFLWWSLVWPGREANSRPTVRETDTLTTKPTRSGQMGWTLVSGSNEYICLDLHCQVAFPEGWPHIRVASQKRFHCNNLCSWLLCIHRKALKSNILSRDLKENKTSMFSSLIIDNVELFKSPAAHKLNSWSLIWNSYSTR